MEGGTLVEGVESRVVRRIFGPRKDEVTGEWRKLHSEELYVLYCSPNIVRVIKPRQTRWAVHVAYMGRGHLPTGVWWGNLREREHSEDLIVNGRIILKCNFKTWDGGVV